MTLFPVERIKQHIKLLRQQQVMLSSDLAALYGVEHRVLVQAVTRNKKRFPKDFMFRLTADEADSLRSQIVISKNGRGGARYAPLAFTEQGVSMLSSVLRSERAVAINIHIMRAFVSFRRWLINNRELGRQIEEMRRKYDGQFTLVFDALEQLSAWRPSPPRRRLGFSVRSA